MTEVTEALRASPSAVTATAPLLSVRNIEVVYDDVILVLRGLSLEVRQGAIKLEKVKTVELPRKPEWLGW